jgi:hypothetical protein
MKTIQSQWESFKKNVIPANAPKVQQEEMERAFYAGSQAMLQMHVQIAEHRENAAVQMLDNLHQEMNAWISAFKKRHRIK